MFSVFIPLTGAARLRSESNQRQHWGVRDRRRFKQQLATGIILAVETGKQRRKLPEPPCSVVLTRIYTARGRRMDDDNLAGSLKAVRDEVAKWLGIDDGSPLVRWKVDQRRGDEDGVEVNIAAAAAGNEGQR